MKRITKNQSKVFVDAMIKSLKSLGAIATKIKTSHIPFTLETKFGTLFINIDTDNSNCYTVYTRFEDVEQAKVKFDCNPYSGKWNFHIVEETPIEAMELISDALKSTLESLI